MASPLVKNVSSADFDVEVHGQSIPVLVDFYTTRCGPCLRLNPVLDELAEEMEGQIKIVKCNIEDNFEVASTFGLTATPTLILFDGNDRRGNWVGFRDKETLLAEINALLE